MPPKAMKKKALDELDKEDTEVEAEYEGEMPDGPEPMEDVSVEDDDSAMEPADTQGAQEVGKAEGISGEPGALIAEKLGRPPEEGKMLYDAAMSIPMYAKMSEQELADLMDRDLNVLMRIEMKAAKMEGQAPPMEELEVGMEAESTLPKMPIEGM